MGRYHWTEKTTGTIRRALEYLGLLVETRGSNVSESRYICVMDEKATWEEEIRISSHVLPPTYDKPGRWEVGPHYEGMSWIDAVNNICSRHDVPISGYVKGLITRDKNKAEKRAAAIKKAEAERQAELFAREQNVEKEIQWLNGNCPNEVTERVLKIQNTEYPGRKPGRKRHRKIKTLAQQLGVSAAALKEYAGRSR